MLYSTQTLLQYFDSVGLKYNNDMRTLSNGKDRFTVDFSCRNLPSIRIVVIVDSEEKYVSFRVWSIVKVDEAHRNAVLNALNKVNSEYMWYKFYLDSDNEVAADADAKVSPNTIGPISEALLRSGAGIVDEAYPEIMKALWA